MITKDLLINLHKVCHFQTTEGRKVGEASKSELRRWCERGSVLINGKKAGWDEPFDSIESLVLFPSSPKRKTTLI